MPRMGELTYYETLAPDELHFTVNKPFSEEQRGLQLMQVGALLSLLPPPPARVLECGCGTGWLSYILAKSGYRAVGMDVSPFAVRAAAEQPVFANSAAPEFVVGDSETPRFDEEFDAVIFFDALHHAVEEQKAVDCAYRALKPGGMLIASETGVGHAEASREIAEKFDVTEKDMPPKRILELGAAAGFSRRVVYPRADHLGRLLYTKSTARWKSLWPLRYLAIAYNVMFGKRNFGLVVMYK